MSFQTSVPSQYPIEIYQFEIYDVTNDRMIKSKRWGTIAGIESIRGNVLRDTKRLVDASVVKSDVEGLTEINYTPA